MTVLVDSNHYGRALMRAQRAANMKTADAAQIFNVTKADWGRFCRGTVPVPRDILVRALDAGGTFMLFRYRNSPSLREIRRRKKTEK